jgi:hypothetical protein
MLSEIDGQTGAQHRQATLIAEAAQGRLVRMIERDTKTSSPTGAGMPAIVRHLVAAAATLTRSDRPASDLHELGYQISAMSREERWRVLTDTAVPELGLQHVVETIVTLTRRTQRAGEQRYRHAIEEWRYDLAHLKRHYYEGRLLPFLWPAV